MNDNIPQELLRAVEEDNLILFIGAGCSLPHGFPTWKDLIKEILLKLNEKYGTSSSLNFMNLISNIDNNSMKLLEVLNKLEDEKNQYLIDSKQIVFDKIDSIQLSKSESEIHDLIWSVSRKIITTNYDKLLEKYNPDTDNIKVISKDNKFLAGKTYDNNFQFLYKIHGDFDNPESLVLFESDYKEIYQPSNHNYDALGSFFKGKTLLFIGFSMSDPFVNDLFKNIKDIYGGFTVNKHFILTTKDDDFSIFDVQSIKIDNWDEHLKQYLKKLVNVKAPIIKKIENNKDIEEIEDLNSINLLIKEKVSLLRQNPSDVKLNTELNDLRKKIDKLYFEGLDYLKDIPEYKNNELRTLFDSIYSSEKFDKNLLDRINNVRTDYSIYKWYDRSVILSAIVCSLIHFNKADEQKIGIIIDFINDNEDKVWQKAITSLFMILNHLGNKWIRFQSIKNKLESIKKNPQLQEACFMIIQLFTIGYHNFSFLSEKIFENDYFKDNPFNYFLPFFDDEKNVGFIPVFENYNGDIEDFLSFLRKSKMPDQIKYLLCNTNSEIYEGDRENKLDKKTEKFLVNILSINSLYHPYSIYIHELINYYKFLPSHQHEHKLKYQLKLTETPIKEYLLNEVEKGKALASYFMKEKNWSQAIVNLIKSDSLNSNNIEILLNLAQCYHYKDDYTNERVIRNRIEKIDINNIVNLEGIYYLFSKEGNTKGCLETINKLIDIDNSRALYFCLRAQTYDDIKKYDLAIDDYEKAIFLDPKNSEYYKMCSNIYLYKSEYDQAKKYIKKADELGHDKASIYNAYANFYRLKGDFDKAMKYIDKAMKLDDDYTLLGTKAVIYSSMGNENEFFQILEKVLQKKISPKQLYPDIKDKYRENKRFNDLIKKYNFSI